MAYLISRILNRFSRNVREIRISSQYRLAAFGLNEKSAEVDKIPKDERVSITYIKESGEEYTATGRVGWTLMETVKKNGLEYNLYEYGFCGGTNFCTFCHTYFSEDNYKTLAKMTSQEKKYAAFRLDYVEGQSRLGCQITLEKRMDGWKVWVNPPSGRGWNEE